jgi:hypothetical protein
MDYKSLILITDYKFGRFREICVHHSHGLEIARNKSVSIVFSLSSEVINHFAVS